MKVKKNVKRTRFIAIVLCCCMLLGGAATVWGAQGAGGVLFEGASLRSINARNINTLDENSKWRETPLKSQLENALKNDLSDTSVCEQVWEFKVNPEEGEAGYDDVHQWCLENPKGTDTNNAFLNEFKNNVEKKEE